MYAPSLRIHYESILASILDFSSTVQSSKLLQAYATFSAMLLTGQTPANAYNQIQLKYSNYKYALLYLSPEQCKKLTQDKLIDFTDITLQDFLICITPDIVCDPFALMEHSGECITDHQLDQFQLVHHIIAVKLNSYQKIAPNTGTTVTSDVFSAIYHHYTKSEKYPLSEKNFKIFYSDINLYELNPGELSPKLIHSSRKMMTDLLSILFGELQLTRAQSIKMVRDFFCGNVQAVEIYNDQQIHNFVKNKDYANRVKLLNKALKLMAKFSPLELISEISLRKKEGVVNEKNKSEALVIPNDITLENGFVFSLFLSEIYHNSNQQILVLLPTPHFTSKVLWSYSCKQSRITFVFQDKNIAEGLICQANSPSYAPAIHQNIRFLSLEQWLEGNEMPAEKYSTVLFFGTKIDVFERNKMTSVLVNQCSDDSTLIVLDHSQYIENNTIDFSNDDIIIHKIGLIPQGINNSTLPRRKVLLRCTINPVNLNAAQTKPIELHTYTLNTDLKLQALSPMHEAPVLINRAELSKTSQTLRQQYSLEITRRHAAGRERNPSFCHEITPDIVVWCSKTYPKNNACPRLEAYVCKPAPVTKINSGYKERGARIKTTIKHTTTVPDEKILNWLENVYPYSIVSPKRSTHQVNNQQNINTASQQPATNIQEEIISHYTEYLQGHNIALKTLWYLYPSLADRYSKSSYEILSSMMNTVIGQQKVCDLTAELCEYWLITTYPELSDNALWTRYEMLVTMLDQAVAHGYCTSNNLRQALRQAQIRDKLFAQVRKALTKKHFTRSEMQKTYTYLLTKIGQGEAIYWGVLLRLMTGLESKIVCALRWCDLLFSSEYNMYSIIIARQMHDDGSFKGFYDNEDYLTFPIPQKLLSLLLKLKQDYGIKNDTPLILSSLTSSHKAPIITPKHLNELTREVIHSIGIDERIIYLPHHNGQERETDLNKYSGDIIRENFRYWATETGNFNADELSYLLRNKPHSTLGCYYCDFLNEASQLILYVKLNRMEAAIANNPSVLTQKLPSSSVSSYKYDPTINANARKTLLAEIYAETEVDVEVDISSPFGVSYTITTVEKEDT